MMQGGSRRTTVSSRGGHSQGTILASGSMDSEGSGPPGSLASGAGGSIGAGSGVGSGGVGGGGGGASSRANLDKLGANLFGPKKICGDIFGSTSEQNLEGILYKSRTQHLSNFSGIRRSRDTTEDTEDEAADEDQGVGGPGEQPEEEDAEEVHDRIYGFDSESDDEEDDEAVSALTAKQRLTLTLKNWCMHEDNVKTILEEGAVQTLVSIAKSNSEDGKVKRFCAQAFFHLSEKSKFRKQLVDQGAMAALLHLSNAIATAHSKSRLLRESLSVGHYPLNCAAAICNLTLLEGGEEQLVRGGAVAALRMILTHQVAHNPGSNIAPICVQALFNLTCVEEQYEELDQVIKALISVPPSGQMDPRVVTTSASCNSSNFFKMRARMLEGGVVQVLGGVVADQGDVETLVQHQLCPPGQRQRPPVDCSSASAYLSTSPAGVAASKSRKYQIAVVLHNMATARACRADMVLRGAGTAVMQMAHDPNPALATVVAATLEKLSLDQASRPRLLDAGIIASLQRVARTGRERATSDPALLACLARECASTVYNLSSDDRCVRPMVHEGSLSLLVDLCTIDDKVTRKSCANSFCNIMAFEETHAHILRSKTLPPLFDLSTEVDDPNIVYALAVAFLNLSLGESTRGDAVAAGIVQPLVRFSRAFAAQNILECCSAALSFLAMLDSNIETMVRDGVLDALASMLTSGYAEVTSRCAGALATIAYNHESHESLLKAGLLKSVVQAAVNNTDSRTRESCCAVLASLSFTAESRRHMRDLDVIPGFLKIVAMDDKATCSRIITALCNLAMEPSIRKEMVDQGVVALMSDLSNTYSETALQDCAKCLCNLSCDPETPWLMVEQGALSTLMMICMVRSVSDRTKLMCAKALLNLVYADTLTYALETGIVHALGALSHQDNSETMEICANLFCVLSCNSEARLMISQSRTSLQGLFSLMRSKDQDTQVLCGKAVCNLLSYPESKHATTRSGALLVIKVLATLGVEECEKTCASALTVLAQDEACCDLMVQEKAANVLVLLSQSSQPETVIGAVKALSCLSFFQRLRQPLVEAGAVSALMCLVLSGRFMEDIKDDCARTLCYLTMSKESRDTMVEEKCVYGLVILCSRAEGSRMIEPFCAAALQRFSWSKSTHAALLDEGGVDMAVALIRKGCEAGARGVLDAADQEVVCDCMTALANMAGSVDLADGLVAVGVVDCLELLAKQEQVRQDTQVVWRIAYTIFHLSQHQRHRHALVEKNLVPSLVELVAFGNDASKQCCAAALCNLSKEKSVQAGMLECGALSVLVNLSQKDNKITKQWCSIAIANLSAHAELSAGTVSAMLALAEEEDEEAAKAAAGFQLSEQAKTKAREGTKKIKALVNTGLMGLSAEAHRRDASSAKALRSTDRLMMADEQDGQLIRMPPATAAHIGSAEEHSKHGSQLVHEMERMHHFKGTRTEAGDACPEMKPPRPPEMTKVKVNNAGGAGMGGSGSSGGGGGGGSPEDEEDGGVAAGSAAAAVVTRQNTQMAAAFAGDDIIRLCLPKITKIPDLEPQQPETQPEPLPTTESVKKPAVPGRKRATSRVVPGTGTRTPALGGLPGRRSGGGASRGGGGMLPSIRDR